MRKKQAYSCLYCGKENAYKGVQYANKYCDNVCSAAHASHLHKQKWLAGELKVIERPTLRRYLGEDRGYKCEVCSISDWQGKPITLQVDHINGDAGNNEPDNIRLICPNCHSQTDSFGGGNKGFGRAARGLARR